MSAALQSVPVEAKSYRCRNCRASVLLHEMRESQRRKVARNPIARVRCEACIGPVGRPLAK